MSTDDSPSARPYRIRRAAPDDLPSLQELERAAGVAFRAIGMPEIADDEPLPIGVLTAHQHAGTAWVAVDDSDRLGGYLVHDEVDGQLHVEQVSVHPDHAHQRIGRALLDHVARRATPDVTALTLTTFRDVPWNAPLYARYGFRVLDEAEWTPGLRAIRAREAALGLDRWPRVCMRRDL